MLASRWLPSLGPPRALSPCARGGALRPWSFAMIAPETYDHIELIKKRAGQLWRFL